MGEPEPALGPLSLYVLEFSIASKAEVGKRQNSWVTSNEHLGAGVSSSWTGPSGNVCPRAWDAE